MTAPEVFELSTEDGHSSAKVTEFAPELPEAAKRAALTSPEQAILIEEQTPRSGRRTEAPAAQVIRAKTPPRSRRVHDRRSDTSDVSPSEGAGRRSSGRLT